MSRDGQVVAGQCDYIPAFRWTAAHGMENLGILPTVDLGQFWAEHVSDDGTVIAGGMFDTFNPTAEHTFRWTAETGMQDIGVLDGMGPEPYMHIYGMSGDGTVIVGQAGSDAGTSYAGARWSTRTGEAVLETLTGLDSATCVSRDGNTIFGWRYNHTASFIDAVLWRSATDQRVLGHFEPTWVSDDGNLVRGRLYQSDETVQWTPQGGVQSTPQLLGPVGSESAGASLQTQDGSVMVGWYGTTHLPCIWFGSGTRGIDLLNYFTFLGGDPSDWSFSGRPTGMSADGLSITGQGVRNPSDGHGHAYLMRLGPVCSSADFNHDGDSGTDADIEAFFACVAGNCCATCYTADFNGDGDTATDADIEAFFRVLAGGSC